ncbi:MAG TPA: ribulose bisphosphate carboxylase small subunit [Vicinamibacteria bacterium]|nr:ribulose bisphosphate carboxylase small subunit [Vicinamibacteria bacterium]
MRVTQGTFSYLPDFDDEQIRAQVRYCLEKGWAVSVEYTDDPHPRNVYWEMWGLPLFDLTDPYAVMKELDACRQAFPRHYIRVNGYDRRLGRQTIALSFIVNRPKQEPGFHLERTEVSDRRMRYSLRSYAADRPSGERYVREG